MSAIHYYILFLTAVFFVAARIANRELVSLEAPCGHEHANRSLRDKRNGS